LIFFFFFSFLPRPWLRPGEAGRPLAEISDSGPVPSFFLFFGHGGRQVAR